MLQFDLARNPGRLRQGRIASRGLRRGASRRREQRHAAGVNHFISKRIVTTAERTGCGIALEDLSGIRDRVRLRKDQRAQLHSWSFHQLASFVEYKAKRAGVPLVYVDPAYTSRQCSECGYTDRKNRVGQATFVCRACGVIMQCGRQRVPQHRPQGRDRVDHGA